MKLQTTEGARWRRDLPALLEGFCSCQLLAAKAAFSPLQQQQQQQKPAAAAAASSAAAAPLLLDLEGALLRCAAAVRAAAAAELLGRKGLLSNFFLLFAALFVPEKGN